MEPAIEGVGFEDGEGATSQGVQELEPVKGKQTGSPLEPPEGIRSASSVTCRAVREYIGIILSH